MKNSLIAGLTILVCAFLGLRGSSDAALADGFDIFIDDDPSYLSLGIGYFDLVQEDNEAADFRLEYRHGQPLYFLKPWLGLEVTSDGSFYGLGGLLVDLGIGERIAVTGSLGAGAYSKGDGKDLGDTIEFRSQIEVAYRFDNASRLGIAFSHISNASIGDDNPGTEILSLYYHFPISTFFGR